MEILVKGKIIGKGRPRTNFKTGIIYTPKATKDYERLIRKAVKGKVSGAITIDLQCHFKLPKNTSKKQQALLIGKPCMKKPDIDNIVKIYLDAFNGHLFDDDRQVFSVNATKIWDTEEYVLCMVLT